MTEATRPSLQRQHTGARMSKIVRHGDVIYLSGQTSSGHPSADTTAQTQEVLARIDALLHEAGTDRSRLLSATIYLRDIADFAAMNSVWEAWMPAGAAPARTTVQAHLAAPGLLVEITVVAAAA